MGDIPSPGLDLGVKTGLFETMLPGELSQFRLKACLAIAIVGGWQVK